MTGANCRRGLLLDVVTVALAPILVGASCSREASNAKADAAECFGKSVADVQLVAHGTDFGGWQLFATHDWQGRPYALALRAAWSESGCGNPGDGNLRSTGGGSTYHGKSLNYVYGTVSDPVRKVRVSYAGGPVQEIEPVAASDFNLRFFVDVREATGGATLIGLDSAGNPVPGATS